MSSKMKRRRQAQRLQQQLSDSTFANNALRHGMETAKQEMDREREKNLELSAQVKYARDFTMRELARYKFIDEMIERIASVLPLGLKLDYLSGTEVYVDKAVGFPHMPLRMLSMKASPYNPTVYGELDMTAAINEKVTARNQACETILLYALEAQAYGHPDFKNVAEYSCIRIAFDGDKRYTCMVPGFIADMPRDVALEILRRELTPAFYEAILNVKGVKNAEQTRF